jgi:hypothetical protein
MELRDEHDWLGVMLGGGDWCGTWSRLGLITGFSFIRDTATMAPRIHREHHVCGRRQRSYEIFGARFLIYICSSDMSCCVCGAAEGSKILTCDLVFYSIRVCEAVKSRWDTTIFFDVWNTTSWFYMVVPKSSYSFQVSEGNQFLSLFCSQWWIFNPLTISFVMFMSPIHVVPFV